MDKATIKARNEKRKLVNRTAFRKATKYEGRFGGLRGWVVKFCVVWGLLASIAGFLAILTLTTDASKAYSAFVGYFFLTGFLCLPVTINIWKKFKKAKRVVLKIMVEEEKQKEAM